MASATISVKIADFPVWHLLVDGLKQIIELHAPQAGDEWAEQRCSTCIAGYDRDTGQLVNVAWPCSTAEVLTRMRDDLDL